jgi:hypothetical protein
MSGMTALLRMNGAWKFTSTDRFHLLTGKSRTGMKYVRAALLTSTSTGP